MSQRCYLVPRRCPVFASRQAFQLLCLPKERFENMPMLIMRSFR